MIKSKQTNGFIGIPAVFILFLGMLITPLISNAQNKQTANKPAQEITIDVTEVSYYDGLGHQNAMNSVAHSVLTDFQNAFSLSYTKSVQPEFRIQTYPIRYQYNLGNLTPADGFLREKLIDYNRYGISFVDVIMEMVISMPQAIIGGNRFINRQLTRPTDFTIQQQLPTLPDRQ